MLLFNKENNLFHWQGHDPGPEFMAQKGLNWSKDWGWYTYNYYDASLLTEFADPGARHQLSGVRANIATSHEKSNALCTLQLPCPEGLSYFPFQQAGAENIIRRLAAGHLSAGLFDEQGVGKTIQAIAVANYLRRNRVLVICPAMLRLNWMKEFVAWGTNPGHLVPALTNKSKPPKKGVYIASYELAHTAVDFKPELVIIDEGHYLKNADSGRTQKILGDRMKGLAGLVTGTPTLYLAGTPIPNGKPSELWPILYTSAPDIIDNKQYYYFIKEFCLLMEDRGQFKVIGAKHEDRLYARLRGSGFMTRRLKKDVLEDLPGKQYQMIVFPEDTRTAKVLKKEKQFDLSEIVKHGRPSDVATSELRREMGLAKLPVSIRYIEHLLSTGVEKVGVFAHHVDVCKELHSCFDGYGVAMIIGGMGAAKAEAEKTRFQEDPGVRVFVGNEAAAVGHTLTAAHHVVDMEPEWVPGLNEQRYDRFDRIGQTKGVTVHILVVQGSIDARVLSAAAGKRVSTSNILDGEI